MKQTTLSRELVYDRASKSGEMIDEHKLVLKLVGKNKDVLEVGCHTGYFTRLLCSNGCKVVGVEINTRAACKAEKFAKKVIIGDIEDENIMNKIERRFDVILLMHILEHLFEPWRVLKSMKRLLKPNGCILITIPNIACWSVRKELFFRGKFEYTETGMIDRTHIRFFTFTTAQDLILNAGYKIEEWQITVFSTPLAFRLAKVPLIKKCASWWRIFLSNYFPNLCGAVFLFKAKID